MFSPLQQAGETKIFGPAYTVQMVEASNTTAPKTDKHFADGIEKDSVVFISQPKGMYSACWGGLMSTRAKYLGAQGVVIDGNFRDINEHRGMGFPVSSISAMNCYGNADFSWKSCSRSRHLRSARTLSQEQRH
jgi:regulator of RNase E activity RraA